MFREMRRSKQVLSQETAEKILREGEFGVLALSGDDGYSYAVPINYAVEGNKIYFHSAKTGHKLDAIRNNDKVSFCVVDKHEVVAEEFTTYFTSAIAFGRIKIVEDNADPDKLRGLELLADKYSSTAREPPPTMARTLSIWAFALAGVEVGLVPATLIESVVPEIFALIVATGFSLNE